jgi:hypothetical protein
MSNESFVEYLETLFDNTPKLLWIPLMICIAVVAWPLDWCRRKLS